MLNFQTFNSDLDNFSQSLLLAWLSTKLNLNKSRLEHILQIYPDVKTAISDSFLAIDKSNNKWLAKWNLPQVLQTKIDIQTQIQLFWHDLQKYAIEIVTLLDDFYPPSFLTLEEDLPLILYYQGNLNLLNSPQKITVVGSRVCSNYSQVFLPKILKPVCQLGVVVISGLAMGVDAFSHQIALDSNSPTIAIIGSGINDNVFYPSTNLSLKKQILEQNGLVLSEYPPHFGASRYTFPRRNRLLAAASDLTWVVEASIKSGSLITSQCALTLNKTVATTPASILEVSFSGNLELIKNGANIISDCQDILQLLGLKSYPQIQIASKPNFDSILEQQLYEILNLTPQNIEEISQRTKLDLQSIASTLSLLELNGLAKSVGQNEWIKYS